MSPNRLPAPPGPEPTPPRAVVSWIDTLERRLTPLARRIGLHGADMAALLLGLVAVIVAAIGLQFGSEIYEAVRNGMALNHIDMPTLRWMIAHRSTSLNNNVTTFTHLGGPTIFPALFVVVLLALGMWRRGIHEPLVVALGSAGALAFTVAGKGLTDRARPDHSMAIPPFESTPSFPSGHTVIATVFATLTAYCALRYLHRTSARVLVLTLAAAWALLMGLSRVYLGHHWLTDVAAGWAFAFAWAAIVVMLDVAWRLVREHRRTHPHDSQPADHAHPAHAQISNDADHGGSHAAH